MTNLDDPSIYTRLDPAGMRDKIADLPQQCRDAWHNVEKLELPEEYRQVQRVMVLGLGGSAIGGDLVRTLIEDESRVPVLVNREYGLPAFVDSRTLVIASSYSGNTEETLSAFEQAHERGAKLIAVTTGGKILARTREWYAPALNYTYSSQPRAALGHSFVPLLGIFSKLGFISSRGQELEQACRALDDLQRTLRPDIPTSQNPAKQLAQKLYDKVPVIYGSQFLGQVAHRWKTQCNENAKTTAFYEEISELNHNAVVGYAFPREGLGHLQFVLLHSSLYHPRQQARFEITRELLDRDKLAYETVEAQGPTRLAQLLWAVHLGDYVTYYLALLNGTDPTPVPQIDYLKGRLSEFTA